MEYKKTYQINQLMHVRPCTKVIQWTYSFQDDFPGIEIRLDTEKMRLSKLKPLELDSILDLLIHSDNYFKKGTNVDIHAKGEYPITTLKDCVEKIGQVFSLND